MKVLAGFSPMARGSIVAAAIAVLVMFLKAAAAVVAPMLLAVFIAAIATPPLRWMRRRRVPRYFALVIVLLVLLDFGSLVALVITGALEGLRESLPTYQERLSLLNQQIGHWLEDIGIENSREALPDLFNAAAATRLVSATLANISGTCATGLLVLLAVVFMLVEAPGLPMKLKAAFNLSPSTEERLGRLLEATNQYMFIKCLTSLATGVCVWILLWLLISIIQCSGLCLPSF